MILKFQFCTFEWLLIYNTSIVRKYLLTHLLNGTFIYVILKLQQKFKLTEKNCFHTSMQHHWIILSGFYVKQNILVLLRNLVWIWSIIAFFIYLL